MKTLIYMSEEIKRSKPDPNRVTIIQRGDSIQYAGRDTNSPSSLKWAAYLRFWMRIDAAKDPEIYGSWANL